MSPSVRQSTLLLLLAGLPLVAGAEDDLATSEPVDDNAEYARSVEAEAPGDDSDAEAARASREAPEDSSDVEAERAAKEAPAEDSEGEAYRAYKEASVAYDPEAAFPVEPSTDDDAESWPGDSDEVHYEGESLSDVVTGTPTAYATDRVVVGFSLCRAPSTLTIGSATARKIVDISRCEAAYQLPRSVSVDSAVRTLARARGVSYAERDYLVEIHATPNDTYYPAQWNLHKIGAGVAWEFGAGDGVVVAVIDTGVSASSGDGLNTLLPGWDFVSNDADAADQHGHGSHVAATVAQATDNSAFFAGLAYESLILPVRVLDASGSGSHANVAAGINWAVAQGADVINLSLGSASGSTVLANAVAAADAAGVLVVASSGNDYTGSVGFPAAYPTVMAVGSTDPYDARASYSNWGTNLDIMAPGGTSSAMIFQSTPWSNFTGKQGTSMAAPHVSALGAMLIGAGATADEAEAFMEATATDLGAGGYDTTYGHGRIRAAEAMSTYTTPFTWIGGSGSDFMYWWNIGADDDYLAGDFTGDGQDELLALNDPWSHMMTWTGSNWQYLWGTGSGWIYWWNMDDTDQYVAGDFDGDGRDDLLALNDPWTHLMTWNGSSFVYEWGTGAGWIHWWNMADDDQYLAGDFDGDGKDELLAINDPWSHLMEYDGTQWNYVWGTGSGWIHWWNLDAADRYVVADLDGDGDDELVAIRDPYVQVLEWTGSGFSYAWGTSSGWLGLWNLSSVDTYTAGDFDGDGADELFSEAHPWTHLHSFTGSGWSWDWGQGAGLFELWYTGSANRFVAGEFAMGAGNDDLLAISEPWWHLMIGE